MTRRTALKQAGAFIAATGLPRKALLAVEPPPISPVSDHAQHLDERGRRSRAAR